MEAVRDKGKSMSCNVGKLLLASMVVVWPGMSNAQTYTRTETTTYIDDSARWVLGQVAQTTINGVVDSQTTFNASTQPNRPNRTASTAS